MIKLINEGNNVSKDLPNSIDNFLQDFAQVYGEITYNDIANLGSVWSKTSDSQKKSILSIIRNINKVLRDYSGDLFELSEEDSSVNELCKKLISNVNQVINDQKENEDDLKEDSNSKNYPTQIKLSLTDKSKDIGDENDSKLYDLSYNGIIIDPKDDDIPFAWDYGCKIEGSNFIIEGDFGQQGSHSGSVKITLPLTKVSKYYDIYIEPTSFENYNKIVELFQEKDWILNSK